MYSVEKATRIEYQATLKRVARAAALDPHLYNQVEKDRRLTVEALLVVVFAFSLSGIGAFIGYLIGWQPGRALGALLFTLVAGVLGYYLWVGLTYLIGKYLFGGLATADEMLRTLGYAHAPRALGLFSFAFCLAPIVTLIAFVWSLAAGVIAVREGMDFDTPRAAVTVVLGALVIFVVQLIFANLFGFTQFGLR